MKIQKEN